MPDGTRAIDQPTKKRRRGNSQRGSPCSASTLCDVPAFMVPKSIRGVRELARMIALAEWAPQSYRDIEKNYVQQKIELAIMHGATVGLGPIAAVQSIALINGTPTIWGDGALALVERSGLLEDMVEQYEFDAEQGLTAICMMKRRHRPTQITNRFSIAMADCARLTQMEGPWKTYPQRMLRMRARSWTIRDGFADVLRGLHIREEVDDYTAIASAWQPSATASENTPLKSLRVQASRRPMRCTPSTPAKPGASEDATAKPQAELAGDGSGPIIEGPQEPEAFTLVDADGAFIDLAGPNALLARFEEVFFDKHLSADQIIGMWESNEMALEGIARLIGPEALSSMTARFQSAQIAQNQEHEKLAVGSNCGELRPTSCKQSSGDGPANKSPADLSNDVACNGLVIREFRQANQPIENRPQNKLANQMKQIDAIYERARVISTSDGAPMPGEQP